MQMADAASAVRSFLLRRDAILKWEPRQKSNTKTSTYIEASMADWLHGGFRQIYGSVKTNKKAANCIMIHGSMLRGPGVPAVG